MTKRLITLITLLLLSAAGSYAQSAQAVMEVKLTVLKAAEVEADLVSTITGIQLGEVNMGKIKLPAADSYQLSIPDFVTLKSREGQTLELSLHRSEKSSNSDKLIILNGKIAKDQLRKSGAYHAEVYTTIEYM